MATAANATRTRRHSTSHCTLAARILGLIPGLLLLTAVGYAGKFIEQSIAAYTKCHHITFPEHRIRAVGDCARLADLKHCRHSPRLSGRSSHLRVLAESRHRAAWARASCSAIMLHLGGISLSLVAVALTLSLTFMHLLGRTFKLKPKLTSLARRRLVHLRSVGHYRCQACH